MRVVRSPVASGRILSTNLNEPAKRRVSWQCGTPRMSAGYRPSRTGRSRCLSSPPTDSPSWPANSCVMSASVSVVMSIDAYLAEDAADLVFLDLEDMPAILDPREPAVHPPDLPSHAATLSKGYGDVDAAFDGADVVVELEVGVGRHTGVPLETRGAVALYDGATRVLMCSEQPRCPTTTATP